MIKGSRDKTSNLLLKAVFKGDDLPKGLLDKEYVITDYLDKNESYIFLGEKTKFVEDSLDKLADVLVNLPRVYQVDLKSFETDKVNSIALEKALYGKYFFVHADLYSAKTDKKNDKKDLILYKGDAAMPCSKVMVEELKIVTEAVNYARNLQFLPPNICNSEYLAENIEKDLKQYDNLKVTILNKQAIEKEKMNLFLSVNRGSMYEPRLVVIEYNGDPSSKAKTALVGKGITFDSGGYSLKRSMVGMKYDMSGAVVAAATMKALAQLKPQANFVAVLPITDNRVNGDASLPDSVWTSMNGKSVEVNNTDAEGRLILADGLTYAIRKLQASRLVTIATLTGAILVALGNTYTGVWATNDQDWKNFKKAAKTQKELVWRMPLHEEFSKGIKGSLIADLKNTDLSGKGGSNSAAMFLKEFTEDKDFLHLDIAGTAESGDKPLGVMVKTLVELALHSKDK